MARVAHAVICERGLPAALHIRVDFCTEALGATCSFRVAWWVVLAYSHKS